MMTDARCGFCGQEVATGRLEKRQDGIVLPGGCIRDIDDHLCAGKRFRDEELDIAKLKRWKVSSRSKAASGECCSSSLRGIRCATAIT